MRGKHHSVGRTGRRDDWARAFEAAIASGGPSPPETSALLIDGFVRTTIADDEPTLDLAALWGRV